MITANDFKLSKKTFKPLWGMESLPEPVKAFFILNNMELIKITENNGKKAVDARELHNFLCIDTPFSKWIKRMLDYGFEENIDWTKMSIDNQAFSDTIVLSLDCAKEISMIQRSDKGKQARKYFIACEKKLIEATHHKLPQTFSEALQLAADQAKKIELQQCEIKELKPKGEFYDAVTGSTDTVDMASVAKVLNIKGIGRNKLFEILRDKSILMKNNQPYQHFIDRGYFRTIESEYQKPDGSIHISIKTVVFQKGVDFIRKNITE